jgi:prefoldin subunit 5
MTSPSELDKLIERTRRRIEKLEERLSDMMASLRALEYQQQLLDSKTVDLFSRPPDVP